MMWRKSGFYSAGDRFAFFFLFGATRSSGQRDLLCYSVDLLAGVLPARSSASWPLHHKGAPVPIHSEPLIGPLPSDIALVKVCLENDKNNAFERKKKDQSYLLTGGTNVSTTTKF